MIHYQTSIITSSTPVSLQAMPTEFPGLDTVELYIGRERDMGILGILPSHEKSLAQVVCNWNPDTIEFWHTSVYVTKALQHIRPTAIATYFPEITSADSHLAKSAIQALSNTMRLADAWGIGPVEIVCGRLAEECRRPGIDCQAVIFDAEDPARWRQRKIDWLVEGLHELYEDVCSWDSERKTDITLSLEIEPGLLFVLQEAQDAAAVLKATNEWKLIRKTGPHAGESYHFVSLNADLGHFQLMGQGVQPAWLWHAIFRDDVMGSPLDRTANFHISDHPLNLVHCDCPPSRGGFNEIRPQALASFAKGETADVEGFTPWLNCFLCIAEYRRSVGAPALNISLELEAEHDRDRVREGLKVVQGALEDITQIRCDYAGQLDGLCRCSINGDEHWCPAYRAIHSTAK